MIIFANCMNMTESTNDSTLTFHLDHKVRASERQKPIRIQIASVFRVQM